jgi:hypothetical protein
VVLCFADRVEVCSVEESTGRVRVTARKDYDLGSAVGKLKLFQIPQPCDNVLNVFFEETKGDSFVLWSLEVEFLPKEVRMGRAGQVY